MHKKIKVLRERVGVDLDITADVRTNGQLVSLRGRDISVIARSYAGVEESLPFTLEGETKVRFHFLKRKTGFYSFSLCENWNKNHGSTVGDIETAIELMPYSWLIEDGAPPPDMTVRHVDLGVVSITTGVPGLSAYEVAQHNGFKGTEAEWLESLRGGKFSIDDLTPEDIQKLQKPALDAIAKLPKLVFVRGTKEVSI